MGGLVGRPADWSSDIWASRQAMRSTILRIGGRAGEMRVGAGGNGRKVDEIHARTELSRREASYSDRWIGWREVGFSMR